MKICNNQPRKYKSFTASIQINIDNQPDKRESAMSNEYDDSRQSAEKVKELDGFDQINIDNQPDKRESGMPDKYEESRQSAEKV